MRRLSRKKNGNQALTVRLPFALVLLFSFLLFWKVLRQVREITQFSFFFVNVTSGERSRTFYSVFITLSEVVHFNISPINVIGNFCC